MFSFIILLCAFVSTRTETNGCGMKPPADRAQVTVSKIYVEDPEFPQYSGKRTFAQFIPSSYDMNTRTNIFMFLHGWDDDWHGEAFGTDGTKYNKLAKKHGFITMYPKGKADSQDGSGISWNYGTNNDTSTCTKDNDGWECYDSCKATNRCTRCSWSSCYDDFAFLKTFVKWIHRNFCVDKIYLIGSSNGGMMVYQLASLYPDLFDGYFPIFGLHLQGYLLTPPELTDKPLFHLHDRSDDTIPWRGGDAGWLYVSLNQTFNRWGKVHGCEGGRKIMPTKWSGDNDPDGRNLTCWEYTKCDTPQAYCLYDGQHGDWPTYLERLQIWWLFHKTNVEHSIVDIL